MLGGLYHLNRDGEQKDALTNNFSTRTPTFIGLFVFDFAYFAVFFFVLLQQCDMPPGQSRAEKCGLGRYFENYDYYFQEGLPVAGSVQGEAVLRSAVVFHWLEPQGQQPLYSLQTKPSESVFCFGCLCRRDDSKHHHGEPNRQEAGLRFFVFYCRAKVNMLWFPGLGIALLLWISGRIASFTEALPASRK